VDEIVLRSSEEERQALFEWLEGRLESSLADETERDLFLLATVEAINNAAEHGNDGDPRKRIAFRSLIRPGLTLVSVEDEGPGFEPVFPDLKKMAAPRGRGLGLIKANCDAVLFNQAGNQIVFLKGGRDMTQLRQSAASIQLLPKGVVLVSDLGRPKVDAFKAISEIFDHVSAVESRKVFLDLKEVKLLSSSVWGTIFAQAAEATVELIVLFNASEAIRTAAEQMGLGERHGDYDKIRVLEDANEAMRLMAAAIKGNGPQESERG